MAIEIENPIVIPETILDKMWVQTLSIWTDFNLSSINASVMLAPYNDAGAYAPERAIKLDIPDIADRIQAAPEGKLALAYAALIDALQEEYVNSLIPQ